MRQQWGVAVLIGCIAASSAARADQEHGKQVFANWCAPCHHGVPGGRNGKTLPPGTESLLAKYRGAKPAMLEERTDLSPQFVQYVVRHGIGAMPTTRKTEISDADLADVAAYLARNSPH